MVNTITITKTQPASHSGSGSFYYMSPDGTRTTLEADDEGYYDVSEYDAIYASLTCKGRENAGFSSTGTTTWHVQKIS